MSVTLERQPTAWQTRPGWGIGVDLTPHQVVQARQVKVHRRLIGMALLLVLLACAGVSLLARADRSSAQDTYDEEQARTVGLAASVDQYADITAMQAVTTRVSGDLSTVMAGDVDVVNFLARVNQALPAGVRITEQSVVLNPPAPIAETPAADAAVDPAAGTAPTEAAPAPAAEQPIGTLTLSGNATQISDVTPFVSALNRLRGASDVLPTTVARTDTGTTFTITANLTNKLLTGRYLAETP